MQLILPYQYNSDDLHAGVPYVGDGNSGDLFCPFAGCSNVSISYRGYVFNITGFWPTD